MKRLPAIDVLYSATLVTGAAVLFAWRCSIDWGHMTPRAWRDAAAPSLLIALVALSIPFKAGSDELKVGGRYFLARSILFVLAAVPYFGIIMFNGHLASERLACKDRVVAHAAGTSAPDQITAISKCFEGRESQ